MWKLLTTDNGPLHSFFSKILVGYALRLYDNDMRRNLDVVRNVRNTFAHTRVLDITFEHELIQTELARIIIPARAPRVIKLNLEKAKASDQGVSKYLTLCFAILTYFQLKGALRTQGKISRTLKRDRTIRHQD
jgi:hypothetical protein